MKDGTALKDGRFKPRKTRTTRMEFLKILFAYLVYFVVKNPCLALFFAVFEDEDEEE
jgi:hypothetical protein